MITFRITTAVEDDRRVVLTLPPEVPTGQAELVIAVKAMSQQDKSTRTGLSDWDEALTGRDVNGASRYPLRGSVLRYEQPTEPVADSDWEILR